VWYKEDNLVKDQVHIMVRTAQISKETQQSTITLRHEGQSTQNISRTLKVSSSAKTI
jgi:azurin